MNFVSFCLIGYLLRSKSFILAKNISLSTTLLQDLSGKIKGDIKYDSLSKALYATDASVYRKTPMGVVFPKSKTDIQTIVKFASQEG